MFHAKAPSRKDAKEKRRKYDMTENEIARIVVDAAYSAGKHSGYNRLLPLRLGVFASLR
jgi:hypothetical protein